MGTSHKKKTDYSYTICCVGNISAPPHPPSLSLLWPEWYWLSRPCWRVQKSWEQTSCSLQRERGLVGWPPECTWPGRSDEPVAYSREPSPYYMYLSLSLLVERKLKTLTLDENAKYLCGERNEQKRGRLRLRNAWGHMTTGTVSWWHVNKHIYLHSNQIGIELASRGSLCSPQIEENPPVYQVKTLCFAWLCMYDLAQAAELPQ